MDFKGEQEPVLAPNTWLHIESSASGNENVYPIYALKRVSRFAKIYCNFLKSTRPIDLVLHSDVRVVNVLTLTIRMKGKKAKEQREATKELEVSIHMVKALDSPNKEPSRTLELNIRIYKLSYMSKQYDLYGNLAVNFISEVQQKSYGGVNISFILELNHKIITFLLMSILLVCLTFILPFDHLVL